MQAYAQGDKRWGSLKLGKTNLTMKSHGCFVTSLAVISGLTPGATLEVLNRNNAFNSQGLLLSDIAAKALGLKYAGKVTKTPKTLCIMETDYYAPDYPQHFVVWDPKGIIIDPLDGKIKPCGYRAVSFRLFSAKPFTTTEIKPAIIKPTIERNPTIWERIYGFLHGIFAKGS